MVALYRKKTSYLNGWLGVALLRTAPDHYEKWIKTFLTLDLNHQKSWDQWETIEVGMGPWINIWDPGRPEKMDWSCCVAAWSIGLEFIAMLPGHPVLRLWQPLLGMKDTGWWFGTFFIFPYIGSNHPNWLIFFRGVQTTNQDMYLTLSYNLCAYISTYYLHIPSGTTVDGRNTAPDFRWSIPDFANPQHGLR